MARIPDGFIDDLLARTDIVEVIGARVPLKRQGKEYSARCPFHDERSPSFTVSPTKQFYHCFGCGAHGTAISFLMNYERLEFLDAVDELAKRVGVEVPRDTRARNENSETSDLYVAVEAAQRFFLKQYAISGKAQGYLDSRGVSIDIRDRFGIGYAPDGFNGLRDALGTDERRMKLLERAGLFSKNDSGRVYDKFRDRIMFPIHDRRGRVIAFGGRVLDKEDGPKYLNSPETPLFHKGRELYGLWQVRQAHNKIPKLIVVEGYMDVVALFQHGVDTAVATLGTATTPDHAELLFRNAADVYFCFDGDRAGRGAAWKAVESVLPRMKDGRQAFFLFLPDGEDPDSLVRNEGAEGFDRRLREATPLSQFLFDSLAADVNLNTLEGKGRLAERAKPLLAQIPDGAFGDLMKQRLTELTGVGARASSPDTHVPTQRAHSGSRPAPTPKRSLVRSAISVLLQKPSLAAVLQPPYRFAALRQPGIELLIEIVDVVQQRPEISTGALLEHFAEHEQSAALKKLASQTLPGGEETLQREFLDAIGQLETQTVVQRLDELQAQQREVGLDDAGKRELLTLLQARLSSPRAPT
ncbi:MULTISPECIES: DNA primase [Lysobacter]|uniref:DNA primase n=1 Tax=Lysobacter gummosus TaxID=262324 RepID=A0ABY3XE85_9GAMM|nr:MULTISPECIES: DNA primase [Lysobacter]ALN89481.1 DNA primase [Lysobacter gummosus]UJB18602.1 DNA primase [Lysobacter capsici]UJQ27673.1 DNA primase [Lysobacter gummosus]UNP30127.1 DNA primase [Lysobacter gummosus]